jgi:hypothetical protein
VLALSLIVLAAFSLVVLIVVSHFRFLLKMKWKIQTISGWGLRTWMTLARAHDHCQQTQRVSRLT